MGIRLQGAPSQPAVVYDRVHLTELSIEQPLFTNDRLPPVYKVVVGYRLYGVTDDGTRHYLSKGGEVAIEDFLRAAQDKAMAGNPAMLLALQAIETAVATIITDQTGSGTEIV